MKYTLVQMGRWITAVVMVFGCAAFMLYDIWVLSVYGPDTTISATINAWAYSHLGQNLNYFGVFCFGFVNGAFVVHFLGWGAILDGKVQNSNFEANSLTRKKGVL